MDLEELKNLAKQLPEHQPTEDRSQILRSTLLAAVDKEGIRGPQRSPWLIAAAVAAAAVLAFYAGTRQGASQATAPEPQVAIVMPSLTSPDGASFNRHVTEENGQSIENVQLKAGSLRIAGTSSQLPLRVRTKNSVVEGVATFTIRAADDMLQEVQVTEGRLQVRIQNQPPIVLGPGESWVIPKTERIELAVRGDVLPEPAATPAPVTAATPAPVAEQSRVATRLKPEPVVAPEEPTEDPSTEQDPSIEQAASIEQDPSIEDPSTEPTASAAELAFDSGYRAVKRGDYSQALFELEIAISKAGQPAIKADARYWRIIALARSGRAKASQNAMQEFVAKHGSTSRGGEVATMLGWIYLEQGQRELAAPLFKQGSSDASSRVRASAQAGLKAIGN